MPIRNFKNEDQPTTILRRSPRFIKENQAEPASSIIRRSPRFLHNSKSNEPEVPKTPCQQSMGARLSFPLPDSYTSTRKMSTKISQNKNMEIRKVLSESNFRSTKQNKGLARSEKLISGVEGFSCLRRSARLSQKENVESGNVRISFDVFKKEGNDSIKVSEGNKLKRLTRGSSGRIGKETADSGVCVGRQLANFSDTGDLSDKRTAEAGKHLSKQFLTQKEKKTTGNSSKGNADEHAKKSCRDKSGRFVKCSKAVYLDKGASLSLGGNAELGFDSYKQVAAHSCGAPLEVRGKGEEIRIEKEHKVIGVKRKRNQFQNGSGVLESIPGWTKEQESALQRAYYTAKPTPHFWKKVARMVPGKSAQDCFDRIHADHLTPSQRQPRSRAKIRNLSSLSFSPSKLLDAAGPKSKKARCTKLKSHLVQKTVRQLLQKQYQVDEDQKADLFSVFESTSSTSNNAFEHDEKVSTPKCNQKKCIPLERCQDRPASAHRKQFSRFNVLSGTTLSSPPVLKQVKNKALHEKYIDQLHKREAKRKAASAKAANSSFGIVGGKECYVKKPNAIEAAKNALLLDARDAISQFQNVQANALCIFSDADDDVCYSDEDKYEGEDDL